MIIRKEDAIRKRKVGVLMHVYGGKKANIVLQETQRGHAEEFYHTKSTFMYYIIEGKGSWIIEGKKHAVKKGDLVIIEPNKRFYYKGKLKQLLITVPPYDPKYEHHVRDVKL
jgi:mannose-6-phosphate isomerase-like protein (cupin superfamily)